MNYAGITLKKLKSKCKRLEDFINFVFTYRSSHFKEISSFKIIPWQIKIELYELLNLITLICLSIILEIETANGATLCLSTKSCEPKF